MPCRADVADAMSEADSLVRSPPPLLRWENWNSLINLRKTESEIDSDAQNVQ